MKKLNLYKTNSKTKNLSRDNTPIIKFTNKSIEAFPHQLNLADMTTTKSINIQKRNLRTNSFGYTNTETFPHERNSSSKKAITRKKTKSQNKNKNTNTLTTSSSQLSKKFPIAKIPFQNRLKKVQSNHKIYPKTLNKSKDNCLQHSFVQVPRLNQRLNTHSNNYELSSYEGGSEKSSDRQQATLGQVAKTKLLSIYNDLLSLVTSSSENERILIFEELDKIYSTIVSQFDHKNEEMSQKKIKSVVKENQEIKSQNVELCKKIAQLEKKCDVVIKDNEKLKKDFIQSNQSLQEMRNTMSFFHSELNKIKKIHNSNDFIEHIVKGKGSKSEKDLGDDLSNPNTTKRNEEDTYDNISLAENININDNPKNNNNYGNCVSTSVSSNLTKPSSKLQLNLKGVADFNQEFLENYNDFSPSWRKEADRMLMRGKK